MLDIADIRQVQIELTTRCNARCPMCMRNYRGLDYNSGYPVTELTLEHIKHILKPDFLKQLTKGISFNGNLGDFGLAKHPDNDYDTRLGCQLYMPPEFYTDSFDQKLDVYMLCLTLNELFNGSHEPSITLVDLLFMRVGINPSVKLIVNKRADVLYDIIESGLADDPEQRLTSKEIYDKLIYVKQAVEVEKNKVPNFNLLSNSAKDIVYCRLINQIVNDLEVISF